MFNFNPDSLKLPGEIIAGIMEGVNQGAENIPGDVKRKIVQSVFTELYKVLDGKLNLPNWVDNSVNGFILPQLSDFLITMIYKDSSKVSNKNGG
jgi:hypothetical protein